MTDYAPLEIVHVDLAADGGLAALAKRPDPGRDLFLVFWWRDVPLGHARVSRGQIERRSALLDLVAAQIAPAVGAHLFADGFEGVAPGLERQPRRKAPAIDALLAASEPLERLDSAPREGAAESTVSVVVCTRERPDELARALASLQGSTLEPLEVIVVDNAPSSPGARKISERAGVVYVAEPQPGLSIARNAGVRRARGDLVAFTDDDTAVHPEWLRRLREAFDGPKVMAATGLVLPAELETEAQATFEIGLGGFRGECRRITFDERFLRAHRRHGAPVWRIGAGANMAIRREAFEHVGLFDERLGAGAAGCSEDSEFWYRLLAEGWHCRYEPTAVVFHYHRRDRASLERQMEDYIRGHVAALFVQFARYRHWGNLYRAFLTLPRDFIKRGLDEAGIGAGPRCDTYGSELRGYLRGLALLPLAFRR